MPAAPIQGHLLGQVALAVQAAYVSVSLLAEGNSFVTLLNDAETEFETRNPDACDGRVPTAQMRISIAGINC